MRPRKSFLVPAILLAATTLAVSCAGGMAAMYVWPTGTTVSYEMTTNMTMSVEIPGGGEQAVSQNSLMAYSIRATGPRQFEISITDAEENSDVDMSAGMVPTTSELIGWVGTVTLDERGIVTDATNLEGNSFIEFQGERAFKEQTLQSLFQILPEGPLGPGVEWSREYSFPMNMMGIELDFSVTDAYSCLEAAPYEGTAAFKIGSKSTVSLAGGGEMEGAVVDFGLAGDSEGTTHIASGTGMVLHSENMVRMSGGMSAQGMDVPITMQLAITLRVK